MECCITLGYSADSTIGNAYETADWMRDQGFRSLRVVTANYHMRRSLLELSMAMPDMELVPHPVVAPTVHLDEWWLWPGTANLLVNEYNKLLVASLRWLVHRAVEADRERQPPAAAMRIATAAARHRAASASCRRSPRGLASVGGWSKSSVAPRLSSASRRNMRPPPAAPVQSMSSVFPVAFASRRWRGRN